MTLNYFRAGAGEPLVLMHGIGSRWEVWRPVLDRLAAEHDVIAVDLPGFAGSPMPPPGTPAGAQSLARLMAAFLDELELERPHLAGNSLGGWVALELAKLGRASSVTGLSPAGFHTRREGRYQRLSLAATVKVTRVIVPSAKVLMGNPVGRTALMGHLFGKPWKMPPEDAVLTIEGCAHAAWFDETLAVISQPEHFTGGEHIDVPVTIAWGAQDHLLLPRQAARAVRAIPGARLVMMHGCGHVPTFDDPEQVASVMLEGAKQSQRPVPAPA
jgi:pimeloyl-ACP methyl ester carboxylesterase